MELWDLLDKDRTPLGQTHPRGIQHPMPEGTYHLVVYALTVDMEGRLLLTRRTPNKRSFPGYWEFTGGSALAGEDSITAARRELAEETGLDVPAEGMTLLASHRIPEAFADVYLARLDAAAEDVTITLQEGETDDSQWVTFRHMEDLIRQGKIPSTVAMIYGTVRAQLIDLIGKEFP